MDSVKENQELYFAHMASVLSAISSPVRIKLIHFLSQAPLTVEVVANKLDQSVANTSMHLRKMLKEKIVSVSTVGQKRLYSLHPAVCLFWERFQDLYLEIEPSAKISKDSDDLDWPFSVKELNEKIRNEEVYILDVRPGDEVGQRRLKDQTFYHHIPYSHLSEHIKKLPKRKKIFVLCRGRFCGQSVLAVRQLRKAGFNAYRSSNSSYILEQLILQNEALNA